MMSRDMLPPDVMDVINESEESAQEYFDISLSVEDIYSYEDLVNETDIVRYYRKISSDKMFVSNRNMQSRRHQKSKHVQTDPDISNVTPSWLLEVGKLTEELYTRLGNIINKMHHDPENYIGNKGDTDPKGMKYFEYENGFWRSKLLPSIKIPARIENDRSSRERFTEVTKRKLHSLFDVATRLRNIIPYVTNEPQQNPQTEEDKVKFCSNENSTRGLKGSRLPSRGACTSEPADLPNDSYETGSDSGKSSGCSPECCAVVKQTSKRVTIENALETQKGRHAVQDDCRRPGQIPGVKVSKYTLKRAKSSVCAQKSEPGMSHSLKLRERSENAENSERNSRCIVGKSVSGIVTANSKVTASCSKDSKLANKSNEVQSDTKANIVDPSREKRQFFGQENCSNNRHHPTGSQINFIRRNIMATKNKVNDVRSSAVSNGIRCNLRFVKQARPQSVEVFRGTLE